MYQLMDRLNKKAASLAITPCFLAFFDLSAAAAEYKLYINKDQSTSNVIVFEDNLSATVKHTNEGMELTLPGVAVSLDCKNSDGSNSTGSCVIAVGADAGSTAGGSTSGGSTSGGSTAGGSTSGGSTSGGSTTGECVTTSWNDCSGSTSGGSTSGGSTSGGSTSGGSTSGGSTSGGSTSGGSTSGGSVGCAGGGDVTCGELDYGSGGNSATGRTTRLKLEPGRTTAFPFSVVPGDYYGQVGIVPTSSPFPDDASQVRMWWSTEAGGKPLSDSLCQQNLGREGTIWWRQTKVISFGCSIPNQKATLFLNLKLCISDRLDASCSAPGAKDGSESAEVYISGAIKR